MVGQCAWLIDSGSSDFWRLCQMLGLGIYAFHVSRKRSDHDESRCAGRDFDEAAILLKKC